MIFSLFNSKNREQVKLKNSRLDELRKIPIKTLDEQKEFITLLNPKIDSKFSFKSFLNFLFSFFKLVIMYGIIHLIFVKLNIVFSLFNGILIVMIVPLIINLILAKFNIQSQDTLFNLIRGGK